MATADDVEAELASRGLWPVVEAVASELRTLPADMLGRSKSAAACRARHALWLVLREDWGFSYPDIAVMCGVHCSTVKDGISSALDVGGSPGVVAAKAERGQEQPRRRVHRRLFQGQHVSRRF